MLAERKGGMLLIPGLETFPGPRKDAKSSSLIRTLLKSSDSKWELWLACLIRLGELEGWFSLRKLFPHDGRKVFVELIRFQGRPCVSGTKSFEGRSQDEGRRFSVKNLGKIFPMCQVQKKNRTIGSEIRGPGRGGRETLLWQRKRGDAGKLL